MKSSVASFNTEIMELEIDQSNMEETLMDVRYYSLIQSSFLVFIIVRDYIDHCAKKWSNCSAEYYHSLIVTNSTYSYCNILISSVLRRIVVQINSK